MYCTLFFVNTGHEYDVTNKMCTIRPHTLWDSTCQSWWLNTTLT